MTDRRKPDGSPLAAHHGAWLGVLLLAVHLIHGVAHVHRQTVATTGSASAAVMDATNWHGSHQGVACPLAKAPFSGLAPCLTATPQTAAPAIVATVCPDLDRLLPRQTRGRTALPRAPPLA